MHVSSECAPTPSLTMSTTPCPSRPSALVKDNTASASSRPAKRVRWNSDADSIVHIEGNKPMHILYLYSGDPDRPDGIPDQLRKRGCMVTSRDLLAGCDLRDDTVWCKIEKGVRTIFDFVLMTPPCVSFCPSRGQGPGPRALRSLEEVYGIKTPVPPFTSAETDCLKEGNYHSVQCLKLGVICTEEGVGFALECPSVVFDRQVSLLQFREAKVLDDIPGVADVATDQCPFGALSRKPTNFKFYTKGRPDLWKTTLGQKCEHAAQLWTWKDASGNEWKSWSPHQKLAGRKSADGKWATSAAETYPILLNTALVNLMMDSGIVSRKQSAATI
jgi:hypothetical protein